MEIKKQYRPELEGLRVIAAMLVAIYHIWMMRVSGGVDVFFVVSGFLITTSLLSKYARDGYIKFGTFVLGLIKRLLPSALVVLTFVVVVGYFILPEVRHSETIKEIFASLFYFENWQLAISGTDYLDQHNEKSPVQHFWAMSIQGQFYIIWFLITSFTIFLHKKIKTDFKKLFFIVLSVLFVCSFAYSVYLTTVNQPWAYFDTRTRVWEFAVGGLLMLVIFKVKLPTVISTVLGWIGLAGLVSTGLVLEVETSFPGYVALWPITSAVFIMLAGQNPSVFGVEKLLGSRPMVKLGGLSYGFYLWHWPLLAFYYIIFDTTDVSLLHGILIIAAALLLSYITTTFIEKPIGSFVSKRQFTLKAFTPIISMVVVLLIAVGSWFGYNQYQFSLVNQFTGDPNYPGVMASTDGFEDLEEMEPIPSLGNLKESIADSCQVPAGESTVEICEYGETENYDYTVALVGGSKSTHWIPSLQSFAEGDSIRLLNVTKSGCRLSYNPENDDREQDCIDWNENVVEELKAESPDLVVTLADIGRASETEIPVGYLNQFERFNQENIEIMAIRDTPYFDSDVAECLSQHGIETSQCDADRENVPVDAPWDQLENKPSNVHYVDYTNYICDEEKCPVVIGNVIAYRDTNHMTAIFNETFGPIVRRDLISILETGVPSEKDAMIDSSNAYSGIDTANSENESNKIEKNNLVDGKWINMKGEEMSNESMYRTEKIDYSPSSSYFVNGGVYVSYYDGVSFLKTERLSGPVGDLPFELEEIEDANNIIVSFDKNQLNDIVLSEKLE